MLVDAIYFQVLECRLAESGRNDARSQLTRTTSVVYVLFVDEVVGFGTSSDARRYQLRVVVDEVWLYEITHRLRHFRNARKDFSSHRGAALEELK